MKVFEELKRLDGEEKEILVRNFMRELEQDGQERSLASNQIVSRILDDALPHADLTQVLAMNNIFTDDLRAMCVDPYASHVLQTLLTLSLKYAQVGRFMYNNLEDFVSHTYASHVVRSVLEVCSGVEVQHSVRSSQRSQTTHALIKEDKTMAVPPTVKQVLLNIAVRFTRLPNLTETMSTECGSAVLQSLLSVLRCADQDQCTVVATHIIQHGLPGIEKWYLENPEDAETPDLPPLFQDAPTTRLMEFEEVYEEVSEALASAMTAQHAGVIQAFTSACQRLGTKQASCMQVCPF
ncbi:hypothetical protein GWK47_004678 [Chionoecetes opilio]|uniref:Uncharacterized protein n=1 Tax=Chionoecetes opilio TaxID=41210 RepID=A0A8J4YLF3_CHIOP|nr:hypothetical protein GWK47_004678 [Chionoecetes opilio]